MQRINANRTLHAAAIFLKGNSKPLRDRYIQITERFIIVAKDAEDTAPTWYNLDSIHKLEGVTIPEAKPQTEREQLMQAMYM